MKPRLERWIIVGNVIIGYIFDHSAFLPGTRIMTDKIRFIDPINFEAECLDGAYKLCEPGTPGEHQKPMLGSENAPGQYSPSARAQEKKIFIV